MILLKQFAFILTSLPISLIGWNISPESILEKSKNISPKWIEKALEEDFAAFQQGFSSEDIDHCLEKISNMKDVQLNGFVRIHFRGGSIDSKPLSPLNEKEQIQLEGFLSVLDTLYQVFPLPELDFVVSLSHYADRPLLKKEISIPILAASKEKHHSKIVLIPPLWNPQREELLLSLSNSSWEEKTELAVWRGSPSDGPYGHYDWDFRNRSRLALLSKQNPDFLDARFIFEGISNPPGKGSITSNRLNSSFMIPQEQAKHKYLISIDGASAPSSLEWQLFTKSLVFKTHSNQIQWFYRGMNQELFYISFHQNCRDLIDKIYWAMIHDEEAKIIAAKSYDFAIKTLLDEELFLYLYRVLEIYAKLQGGENC